MKSILYAKQYVPFSSILFGILASDFSNLLRLNLSSVPLTSVEQSQNGDNVECGVFSEP